MSKNLKIIIIIGIIAMFVILFGSEIMNMVSDAIMGDMTSSVDYILNGDASSMSGMLE